MSIIKPDLVSNQNKNVGRCLNTSCTIAFIYLSSPPVAHLSDAPRRRLGYGDSARIGDETTESSAWFFKLLSVLHRHMGPRFKVSSERQLIIVRLTSPGIKPTTSGFQVERSNHLAMRAGILFCTG